MGHINQVGQRAHDDHVGGAVISGGAGQLFHRQPEGPGVAFQLELRGVEDDNAVFPHFCGVVVVGFLVESHQHINVIPGGKYGVNGNAGLCPGGAAQNLRGESGECQSMITHLG